MDGIMPFGFGGQPWLQFDNAFQQLNQIEVGRDSLPAECPLLQTGGWNQYK